MAVENGHLLMLMLIIDSGDNGDDYNGGDNGDANHGQ